MQTLARLCRERDVVRISQPDALRRLADAADEAAVRIAAPGRVLFGSSCRWTGTCPGVAHSRRTSAVTTSHPAMFGEEDDVPPGYGEVVVAMLRIAELRAAESVLENGIWNPTRLDASQRHEAQSAGLVGRVVSKGLGDDSLLADDLRDATRGAYERLRARWRRSAALPGEDLETVALASLAWSSFDHRMRQWWKRGTWRRVEAGVQAALPHLPVDGATYDTRVYRAGRHAHVRRAAGAGSCGAAPAWTTPRPRRARRSTAAAAATSGRARASPRA